MKDPQIVELWRVFHEFEETMNARLSDLESAGHNHADHKAIEKPITPMMDPETGGSVPDGEHPKRRSGWESASEPKAEEPKAEEPKEGPVEKLIDRFTPQSITRTEPPSETQPSEMKDEKDKPKS